MRLARYITLTLTLSLGVCGAGRADPIVALASLLLAKKVTEGKSDKQFENTTLWRDLLSVDEKNALASIQTHPAIQACLQDSRQGNPVAEYHLRKIASFSVILRRRTGEPHKHDALENIAYRRAAKGFGWCMSQAGMQIGGTGSSPKQQARLLASMVLNPAGGVILAMKDRIAAE